MAVVNIRGVDIMFPFCPYECQLAYMDKVIEAIDMKFDTVLESPTGTGKTLSLLCSTLGWLQKQKSSFIPTLQDATQIASGSTGPLSFLPRIYYCSRTHSQLAQVVHELNRTMYKDIRSTVLGSRDQLCIHDSVRKQMDARTSVCRSMISRRSCQYYNKWDRELGSVPDIEDMVATGQKVCPFFRCRQVQERAELVLLPYNYIVDPQLRKLHKIDLAGSIVIFDEAHNLENICEDVTSVEISSIHIALAIQELKDAIQCLQNEIEEKASEIVGFLKLNWPKIAVFWISMLVLLRIVFPGDVLFETFESVGISFDKAELFCKVLLDTSEYLQQGSGYLFQCMRTATVMKFWCFTSSIAMRSLKVNGVRTVIVTSGTLSPLPNFIKNIGFDQIFAAVLNKSPLTEQVLNGCFQNRHNNEYAVGIAESVVSLAKTVPQGILVFFASYSLMDHLISKFKELKNSSQKFPSKSYWEQMTDAKLVVVEPKQKSQLARVRSEFTRGVQNEKGAMFFAVCRGKVSEGIDFSDACSRAVCVVGIPFPPLMDIRIHLKRLYLNELKTQSAEDWYVTEGYRAVNQALGRVLRHVNDFGMVALLDESREYFPSWMRASIKVFDKGSGFPSEVTNFFASKKLVITVRSRSHICL
ncbi:unnamed protein product [Angiostrongylus costaricensis]|uniref:DNA helicase n=1 Tax=Angiostrongylus costaricensis TaxID=334426 RepID=A0A0R3PBW3_ANGCS|nr:unnamed protein product [Angiostrongylus costaricensis]